MRISIIHFRVLHKHSTTSRYGRKLFHQFLTSGDWLLFDVMSSIRMGLPSRRQRFPNPDECIGRNFNTDCEKRPRWQHGEQCWEPLGAALDAYNTFRPTIRTLLNHHCKEDPEKAGLIVGLYMIGIDKSHASPVLVFVCKSRHIARDAEKLVKNSKILKDHRGFRTALMSTLPTGELVQLSTGGNVGGASINDKVDVFFDPNQPIRSLAMPIIVQPASGQLFKATANLVYRGEDYGWITVAHTFGIRPGPVDSLVGWDSDEDTSGDSEEDMPQLSPRGKESRSRPDSGTQSIHDHFADSTWSPRLCLCIGPNFIKTCFDCSNTVRKI
jgi:hypothetical protein